MHFFIFNSLNFSSRHYILFKFMNDFIKSQGLHYEGCIGMDMTKRFNSAGAGKGVSDYYSEDLKEKAIKTENMAFGEPIWIWKKG